MSLGSSTVLGNLLFAGLMLRVVGHSAGATGADGVNFFVSISCLRVYNIIPIRIRMVRIVARNLSKIRIMPSAIVSNRMVYTGIMPLRHSRIIAAAASSVTAGLQMLAMDFCFMSLLFL